MEITFMKKREYKFYGSIVFPIGARAVFPSGSLKVLAYEGRVMVNRKWYWFDTIWSYFRPCMFEVKEFED